MDLVSRPSKGTLADDFLSLQSDYEAFAAYEGLNFQLPDSLLQRPDALSLHAPVPLRHGQMESPDSDQSIALPSHSIFVTPQDAGMAAWDDQSALFIATEPKNGQSSSQPEHRQNSSQTPEVVDKTKAAVAESGEEELIGNKVVGQGGTQVENEEQTAPISSSDNSPEDHQSPHVNPPDRNSKPISTGIASFEELLERELQKYTENGAASGSGQSGRQNFLRKGSRGWWKNRNNEHSDGASIRRTPGRRGSSSVDRKSYGEKDEQNLASSGRRTRPQKEERGESQPALETVDLRGDHEEFITTAEVQSQVTQVSPFPVGGAFCHGRQLPTPWRSPAIQEAADPDLLEFEMLEKRLLSGNLTDSIELPSWDILAQRREILISPFKAKEARPSEGCSGSQESCGKEHIIQATPGKGAPMKAPTRVHTNDSVADLPHLHRLESLGLTRADLSLGGSRQESFDVETSVLSKRGDGQVPQLQEGEGELAGPQAPEERNYPSSAAFSPADDFEEWTRFGAVEADLEGLNRSQQDAESEQEEEEEEVDSLPPPTSELVRQIFTPSLARESKAGKLHSNAPAVIGKKLEKAGEKRDERSRSSSIPRPGASTLSQLQTPEDEQRKRLDALLTVKFNELETEIKKYKEENAHIVSQRIELEERKKALQDDRAHFEQWISGQKALLEAWKDEERKKLARERRVAERQAKAQSLIPDKKERAEIEALKAQIVKMKVEEKQATQRAKLTQDRLQRRIKELEGKVAELQDEVKFLERERLQKWADQQSAREGDRGDNKKGERVSENRRAKETFKQGKNPSKAVNNGESARDSPRNIQQGQTSMADTEPLERSQRYDPGKYQPPDAEWDHANSLSVDRPGEGDLSLDEEFYNEQQDLAESQPSNDYSMPAFIPRLPTVLASSRADSYEEGGRGTTQQTGAPSSKTQVVREDGTVVITFRNGTVKEVFPNKNTLVRFVNGDVKKTLADSGLVIYYYAEADTTHTTLPDGTEVFEFPNRQVEKHFPSGRKEIFFPDGTHKIIYENEDEESFFPDGSSMLERIDGVRVFVNADGSKHIEYPGSSSYPVASAH